MTQRIYHGNSASSAVVSGEETIDGSNISNFLDGSSDLTSAWDSGLSTRMVIVDFTSSNVKAICMTGLDLGEGGSIELAISLTGQENAFSTVANLSESSESIIIDLDYDFDNEDLARIRIRFSSTVQETMSISDLSAMTQVTDFISPVAGFIEPTAINRSSVSSNIDTAIYISGIRSIPISTPMTINIARISIAEEPAIKSMLDSIQVGIFYYQWDITKNDHSTHVFVDKTDLIKFVDRYKQGNINTIIIARDNNVIAPLPEGGTGLLLESGIGGLLLESGNRLELETST